MQPQTDPLAITSLVTGVLTWLSMCCSIVPFVGLFAMLFVFIAVPISLITGMMSIFRVRSSEGALTGSGMAIAGILLSGSYLLLMGVMMVLVFVMGVSIPILEAMSSGY